MCPFREETAEQLHSWDALPPSHNPTKHLQYISNVNLIFSLSQGLNAHLETGNVGVSHIVVSRNRLNNVLC